MTPDEVEKFKRFKKKDDLKRAIQRKAGYVQIADNPAIVTFGKYRGQLLSTLVEDVDYVQWIQQQPGTVKNLCVSSPIFGAELRAAIGAGTAQTAGYSARTT